MYMMAETVSEFVKWGVVALLLVNAVQGFVDTTARLKRERAEAAAELAAAKAEAEAVKKSEG